MYFKRISTALMQKNEVVLIFCFNNEMEDFSNIVNNARKHGAFIIAITNYESDSVTKNSDITILSTASGVPAQDNELTTMLTQLNILDMLYTFMSVKRGGKHKELLSEISDIMQNK